MSNLTNTLGLILARGGSKGIPRKNLKLLAGKPLIAWTIEAALQSQQLSSIVVSTDDPEIAQVAQHWGADIPFLRPTELAQDDTPSIKPVLHALAELPHIDSVMLLQPTSPLRTATDIDMCIALAHEHNASSVVSVTESANHPYWTYQLDAECKLSKFLDQPTVTRRQDLPLAYALNGALYFASASWLKRYKTFVTEETVAYVMPKERSVDLDTYLDWYFAEWLFQEKL